VFLAQFEHVSPQLNFPLTLDKVVCLEQQKHWILYYRDGFQSKLLAWISNIQLIGGLGR
jgi:hypothetical protein